MHMSNAARTDEFADRIRTQSRESEVKCRREMIRFRTAMLEIGTKMDSVSDQLEAMDKSFETSLASLREANQMSLDTIAMCDALLAGLLDQ